VLYNPIVNGDFGGETDNPADPGSILAEVQERCTGDSESFGMPTGMNGDFGGETDNPADPASILAG
jgi:hypothetical protein